MAITSNELSLSSSAPPPLWDVFLSFYGKDTRRNFVANLYFALDQAGISTFRDDPALEKGQEISSGLLSTIRDTNMFVVVISENYARSSWCLNELVEIMSCKKTKKQVIPVFYYVDPSDLRHHKGSFGEAIDYHQKRNYSVDTIDKWKSALAEIAELSGYHLKQDANENESDTVQEIVEHLSSYASTKLLFLEEYLVGIDSAVEEICHKLQMESNDVRTIGICGMGGIGKTTTAKAFYNKYSNRFDIGCYIENEKRYSKEVSSLLSLLQQLLSELLRRKNYKIPNVNNGMRQLQNILSSKKSLIILDDWDKSSHLECLARLCKMVAAGSRIVITTRDVNLLNQLKVDISKVDIYMVKKMEEYNSLELFSYHAFRKPMPPDSFREMSVNFVTYAGGLPLALKVLGSSLRGRTEMSFWEAKLEKVLKIPEDEIIQILRLSFDELADKTEKEIFLDIVFFFIGKDKDEAIHILRSCDFFPDVGIPILVDKCLLEINKYNKFQMHNLIQDMGMEVIQGESKHGICRRLYLCQRNACEALENLEGANKIEGIILNMTEWPKRQLSAKIFEGMPNLRLLEIIDAQHIQGSFANSFHELRYIRWHYCPWTQLPSSFRPQKLVSLDMSFNEFKILWKDTKLLPSLKIINMSYSKKLKKSPDFRDTVMVEKLVFHGCKSMQKVNPSIGQLRNLSDLDLRECYNLKELPETIGQLTKLEQLDLRCCVNLKRFPQHVKQLTNLSSLKLGSCKNLKRLPDELGDMKGLKMLNAKYTAIEQLPDSIGQLKELVKLNLTGCKKLRKLPEQFGYMEVLEEFDATSSGIEELPDSIGQLKALGKLYLSYCEKLRKLPEQFGNIQGLKEFNACHSGIEELPDSIGRLVNLVYLVLFNCKSLTSLPDSMCKLKLLKILSVASCSKLERLPEQLGKMHSLQSINASSTAIQVLPDSVGHLSRLQHLDFYRCKKLIYVPNSIWNLTSLVTLYLPIEDICTSDFPDTVNYMNKLESLTLRCNMRLWLPLISSFSSLRSLVLCDDGKSLSSYSTKWCSFSKLSYLEDLYMDNWGSSFPEVLPINLRKLCLHNHATLEELPDLTKFEQLKKLDIRNCISLQSLPPLPLNLTHLRLYDHATLETLPDISYLENLKKLKIWNYISLQSLPPLPLNLQHVSLSNHATLEQLPDLSYLKQLQSLDIDNCISLQSLPPLPLNLQELFVKECTSLRDVSHLSTLKGLRCLYIICCRNLKSSVVLKSVHKSVVRFEF